MTICLQQVLAGARVERIALPDVPEIELLLLNADFCSAALTPEETQAVLRYPAYWAFCWASGQVLARHVLDHPELVRGKRVLDFGSGSGVVAIAAARAGAAHVVACDIDADALQAVRYNAALNDVAIELCDDYFVVRGGTEVILAADVLYDRANLDWLTQFLRDAPQVIVADSRVRNFAVPGFFQIAECQGSTWPDLEEFDEFRAVKLYRNVSRDGISRDGG